MLKWRCLCGRDRPRSTLHLSWKWEQEGVHLLQTWSLLVPRGRSHITLGHVSTILQPQQALSRWKVRLGSESQTGDPRQKRQVAANEPHFSRDCDFLLKTLTHATHHSTDRHSRSQTSPWKTAGYCFLWALQQSSLDPLFHLFPAWGITLPLIHQTAQIWEKNLWRSGLSTARAPNTSGYFRLTKPWWFPHPAVPTQDWKALSKYPDGPCSPSWKPIAAREMRHFVRTNLTHLEDLGAKMQP